MREALFPRIYCLYVMLLDREHSMLHNLLVSLSLLLCAFVLAILLDMHVQWFFILFSLITLRHSIVNSISHEKQNLLFYLILYGLGCIAMAVVFYR
jgi:hypothetical protein